MNIGNQKKIHLNKEEMEVKLNPLTRQVLILLKMIIELGSKGVLDEFSLIAILNQVTPVGEETEKLIYLFHEDDK